MTQPILDDSPARRVLLVSADRAAMTPLQTALAVEDIEARLVPDGYKALGELDQWPCDVVVTELEMPLMGGRALLDKAFEARPDLCGLVMASREDMDGAIEAMRRGALDFILKPLLVDVAMLACRRALERSALQREVSALRKRVASPTHRTLLLGASAPMQELRATIEQVATSKATVLITGESGSGKELIARAIHENSPRAARPFVRLHCAALSESLLESELFGHERGAFTGADRHRRGRFEEAHGGTLFLDEIGEISPGVQVKLLRFLQEREFERVGGNQTVSVDVRVVAATHQDLKQAVREKRFREDLFFRLNVIHLQAPPLRARRTDIPLLARHFVARHSQENNKNIKEIAPEFFRRLKDWRWPGNVRELENAIERAVVMVRGPRLEVRHLPPDFDEAPLEAGESIVIPGSTMADIERHAILKTYEATGGSTANTAEILDISVRKIRYKLKEYSGEPLGLEDEA